MSTLLNLIKTKLQKNEKVCFFFDYDGVLTPIKKNPDESFMKAKVKKAFINLSDVKNVKVAIVTGRTLDKLNKLTSLKSKEPLLVGSHGFEMIYKNKLTFLAKINKKDLKNIRSELLPILKGKINGFLEQKPYTFTYHIRENRPGDWVKNAELISSNYLKKKKLNKTLAVLTGKNIIEILPKGISKGKAVKKIILMFRNYCYIYIGDDITDISAFKAVNKANGISVSVNKRLNYKADFYLKDTKEVYSFINDIVKIST